MTSSARVEPKCVAGCPVPNAVGYTRCAVETTRKKDPTNASRSAPATGGQFVTDNNRRVDCSPAAHFVIGFSHFCFSGGEQLGRKKRKEEEEEKGSHVGARPVKSSGRQPFSGGHSPSPPPPLASRSAKRETNSSRPLNGTWQLPVAVHKSVVCPVLGRSSSSTVPLRAGGNVEFVQKSGRDGRRRRKEINEATRGRRKKEKTTTTAATCLVSDGIVDRQDASPCGCPVCVSPF